ncbi:MAG: hypothetical protein CMQ51_04015 [Gammaproteobacteria bacterium]|nr:hypothetical protein [Gammaproteobacteria bacterium]
MLKKIKKKNNFTALVDKSLIDQAAAFTAPRGRCEMGGLLLGHVDENGNNVAVCGFFPEQTEANGGYCEFDGSFNALAAAACDYANEETKSQKNKVPEVRIIGWIHTHPDIGIFLSGIDVSTFSELRDHCKERRFMAVVVDPLRQKHGIFNNEKTPNEFKTTTWEGKLSSELIERYNVLLDRLRFVQIQRGDSVIPCIIPGPLRQSRITKGDRDDIQIEMDRGFFVLKSKVETHEDSLVEIKKELFKLKEEQEYNVKKINILEKENHDLRENLEKTRAKADENYKIKVAIQKIFEGFNELISS